MKRRPPTGFMEHWNFSPSAEPCIKPTNCAPHPDHKTKPSTCGLPGTRFRFNWTQQVGHPPPVTESGIRRQAPKEFCSLHHRLLAEKHRRGKTAQHSDLNSGLNLGLKGASDQVEAPFVGDYQRDEQKSAGNEMEGLHRNTDSSSLTIMYPRRR